MVIMVGIFFSGWLGYCVFLWISDMKEKRKGRASRENTQIEKMKTASFWIGVLFLSIPLWAWFFGGFGVYYTHQHTCQSRGYQREMPEEPLTVQQIIDKQEKSKMECIACRILQLGGSNHYDASLRDIIHAKSRGIDIKVFWPQHFFEIIDDEDFVPFALLFGVGCGLIIFSIFNQKWRTEESMVAVVAGVLVWIYLVINIFVGDWWWLNWCLLAIFGAALIIFGTRNLLEKS